MAPRKTVRFAEPPPKTARTTEPPRKRRRICRAADKSLTQRDAKHEGIIQSLELMKIALHACVATLSYVRELLPEYVFGWRQFPNPLPGEIYSYDDFLRGKKAQEERNKHTRIRVLERGMDDAADKILDLLEEGIFDALVRRSLAAVQFSIMTDKERPDTAVETYTITMGSGGKFGNTTRLGCGLDQDMGDAVPIGEVEKDIVSLNVRLTTTLDEPPEIHGPRALGVQLFYTDDCPERYMAHGFADIDSDDDHQVLLFPVHELWTRVSELCGLVNCGFYTAVVRVSWLQYSPQIEFLRHEEKCRCGNGVKSCDKWKPLRIVLKPPLAFEEVVLRESEFGLPWANEVNGEEVPCPTDGMV